MGLLTCLAGPSREAAVDNLREELSAAKSQACELRAKLLKLESDREELLARLTKAQSKQDASTEMPSVSVAVQAMPPVSLESRIPHSAAVESVNNTAPVQPLPEVTTRSVKSRIPAHPASSPATIHTNKVATKAELLGFESTGTSDLIQAVNYTACRTDAQTISSGQPKAALPASVTDSNTEVVELEQRIVLLQQQLKVAEAFRTSLEAQLRDARFASNNLQTQVLSLQTKLEKTIEEQVAELEKLNIFRKEGQERYDTLMSELAECKKQLFSHPTASQVVAYKTEASTAVKRAIDGELKLSQARSKLKQAQEELVTVKAQLNSTEQLVAHMAEKSKMTAEQHQQEIQKLENELISQKAIYDSTVVEMLQLSSNHSDLKQKYHELQSQTKNRDEVVQLVQQELAELSYYAAAGRVALGVAPMTYARDLSASEVCTQLESSVSGSVDTYVGSLKIASLLSTESTKSAAVAAVLASREVIDSAVMVGTQNEGKELDQTADTVEATTAT